MYCLPVAVAVALHQDPEENNEDQDLSVQIVVNPSQKIEQEALAVMTFVFDSSKQKLLSAYCLGEISQSKYEECCALAKEASNETLNFFENSISKKLSADLS